MSRRYSPWLRRCWVCVVTHRVTQSSHDPSGDIAREQDVGHVITPEDVADAISSIITGSDYVTGQLVTLDSGFTL